MTGTSRKDRRRIFDEGPEAHDEDAMDLAIFGAAMLMLVMLVLGLIRYFLW